jgi:hypothetical protein
MATETSNPAQIIEVAEIAWESMTSTIKAKMLWSDPATKRRAQLTRFEPGAVLSLHRHVGDELLYVIEGSISDESGTVLGRQRRLPSQRVCPQRDEQEWRDGLRGYYRWSRTGQRDRLRAALADHRAERYSLDRVVTRR